MKYLILVLSLCTGCATHKEIKAVVSNVSARSLVRTPETVKAYPTGRYTDPNYPDEMHERHTVYRREQSPDWNYLPDPPVALPLGPTSSSPSYYAKAEGELNAQQQAYAEALQEQNRAMKKRIEDLQQEAAKVPELRQEVERLRATPSPSPNPAKGSTDDAFSFVEPSLPEEEEISDPCEIVLSAEDDKESFLISQMRLNDEFAAELAATERRRVSAVFTPFLRRKELALLTK